MNSAPPVSTKLQGINRSGALSLDIVRLAVNFQGVGK